MLESDAKPAAAAGMWPRKPRRPTSSCFHVPKAMLPPLAQRRDMLTHEEVVSQSQPRRRELCPKQSISIISVCSTDTTMVSHMYTLTLVDPRVHAATLIKSAQSHFHMQELNLSLDLARKLEMHKHTFGNLKHVHVGWSCCVGMRL